MSALSFDWISPYPSDFPNVDLSICDYVASGRREMAVHTRAYAVDRLTYVNRHLVEIAKYVAANFVRERANRSATEGQVDRHCPTPQRSVSQFLFALSSGSRTSLRNMPHDRHADAVSTDVIGVVVACRAARNRRSTPSAAPLRGATISRERTVLPSTTRIVWREEPPAGVRRQPAMSSKRTSARWRLSPFSSGRVRL